MVKPARSGEDNHFEKKIVQDYRILMLYIRSREGLFFPAGKKLWEHRTKGFLQKEILPLFSHWDQVFIWKREGTQTQGKATETLENNMTEFVSQVLRIPCFDGYMEEKWVLRLLGKVPPGPFLFLGRPADCGMLFRQIVMQIHGRMKSMLWIYEGSGLTASEEAFISLCEEEYGLVPQCRPGEGSRISCREPVTILDFTEDERIPYLEVPQGSIWLDFAAVPGKARKLFLRKQKINYISQQLEWERIYVK